MLTIYHILLLDLSNTWIYIGSYRYKYYKVLVTLEISLKGQSMIGNKHGLWALSLVCADSSGAAVRGTRTCQV